MRNHRIDWEQIVASLPSSSPGRVQFSCDRGVDKRKLLDKMAANYLWLPAVSIKRCAPIPTESSPPSSWLLRRQTILGSICRHQLPLCQ